MRITLLGAVDIIDSANQSLLSGQRRKAVLGMLALHAGDVVSTDRIIDAVWSGRAPGTPVNTVQKQISYLRGLLGGGHQIISRGNGYTLVGPPEGCDLHQAERLIEAARSHSDPAVAAPLFERARSMWRGPSLADLAGLEAFQGHAQRLDELRLAVVEALMAARIALGAHAELLPELQQLVETEPLREKLAEHLMIAMYRSGRQSDALAVYRRVRRRLIDDLGVEPGTSLQRLEQSMLRQDSTLILSAVAPAVVVARSTPALPLRRPPAPLSGFVGREADLARLRILLGDARLVTVTGLGGVGKTRLSLEAVASPGAPAAEHIAFVDLSTVAATGVVRRIADAVGVDDDSAGQLDDRVLAVLADASMLLVLDNCEHVLDVLVPFIEALAGACPGLRFLATSRERLGTPGEMCLPLLPMAVPPPDADLAMLQRFDAVQLLLRRTAAGEPGFGVTSENADAVAELCRALDGLPLALELASARLRSTSPQELLASFGEHLSALGESRYTHVARHRSLSAALDSSQALLTDAQRRVFRRLAVFTGGATPTMAARVCDPDRPADVPAALADLVDKSLATRTVEKGVSRLSLHRTVQRFALEQLDAGGELDLVRRLHAEATISLATQARAALHGEREPAARRALVADDANIGAALEWTIATDPALAVQLAASLWWYWFRTTRSAEGVVRLREALDAARDLPPGEDAAEAWAGMGYLCWVVDEYHAAAAAAHHAMSVPGASLSTRGLAEGVLARVAGDTGDFDAAVSAAQASVASYSRAGDRWGAAWSLRCEASALLYGGRPQQSLAPCQESRDVFQALGDAWGAAGAADLLAAITDRLGDHRGALALAEDAVARHRAEEDTSGTRYALQHLAEAAFDLGDLERARAAASECLQVAQRHGFRVGALYAQLLLADIDLSAGDQTGAAEGARLAAALATDLDDQASAVRAASIAARAESVLSRS